MRFEILRSNLEFPHRHAKGGQLLRGRPRANPRHATRRPTTPTPGYSTASNPTRRLSTREAEPLVDKGDGVLVLDDSTLDKLYCPEDRTGPPPLVRQAQGRGLGHQPDHPGLDRRRPHHASGLPHLRQAQGRPDQKRSLPRPDRRRPGNGGFARTPCSSTAGIPSLENLKLIRDCGWIVLTRCPERFS